MSHTFKDKTNGNTRDQDKAFEKFKKYGNRKIKNKNHGNKNVWKTVGI